ncbi:DNA methyltransferase [Herminiimonas sp. CN]|uniref:DNA methyltransferase n=1 Tax=Herminiimonas sp. CN TaxID=1349818 RepID=UPI000474061D|nr:DNA methyltransferase [Herminiimonas sp. CN]
MTAHILSEYNDFLKAKIKLAQRKGFDVPLEEINPNLKPHTRDIVRWALAGGQRAVFASFGLHKTSTNLEVMRQIGIRRPELLRLIVLPLGVRQEFVREVAKRFTGEYAIDLRFIRSDAEVDGSGTVYMTNYESVREGKITVRQFGAASLDEASVLRSYGSKTYQEFLPMFEQVEFKFVYTATPSPNRFKEMIHYAGFLGVMDTGQALTRFFQRDSEKSGNLTLYPHKETEFWLWVASWAVFIQKPSDLCGCVCHKEKISANSGSVVSSSSNGFPARSAMAHGVAPATAAERTSQHQPISPAAESSVAVACDQSTEEKEPKPMTLGEQCGTAAAEKRTRTGKPTEVGGSPFANDGITSPHSSPTWASPKMVKPSTGSTILETTSPATANGQLGWSRLETEGHVRIKSYCSACRCDEGYDLPEMEVRYHEVPSDYDTAGAEKNGQGLLIPNVAMGLSAAAGEKRDSMAARVAKVAEIMSESPEDHFLIWHDLEDERHAIQKAIPGVVSVWGTQNLDEREQRIADFCDGKIKDLSTKPSIAGSGTNAQAHCHREIFAGIGFKFNDFIQSIHRVKRFGQTVPVRIDIIHTEVEREVLKTLQEKWARHDEMQSKMGEIIRTYGLDQLSMQDSLARTIGVDRHTVKGDLFEVANNDCVLEALEQPDNSVGLIVTSVPFANHYEYTPSYNDFGHTQDNAHFWAQMDFLTPQLLRILQPGRIYACHVKDRINFGNVTGAGIPTVSPFHAEALFHGIKHGFDYLGMITVVTDVVRENNQTYRLGYSEVCKDGTKMGVGSPEYILLFHKPQSDRSRGYADEPVTKSKPLCLDADGVQGPFDRKHAPIAGTGYSVARWQVDAHAFWRSSGNRLMGAAELASYGPSKLAKMFTQMSLQNVYDYEYHVAVGETMLANKSLPADYLSLAPGSNDPMVWYDIVRMRTLNGEQSARAVEKHVCPFQIDIVDRLINRYSNPGDVVYDPFCGLGTVPVRAMKLGRRGAGSELNSAYFADQVHYCQAMEREVSMPTLFDFAEFEAEVSA